MTTHTIPVAVLVRAAAALKAAKEAPSGQSLSVPVWHAVMVSCNEMQGHLELVLKDQQVPVAVPA